MGSYKKQMKFNKLHPFSNKKKKLIFQVINARSEHIYPIKCINISEIMSVGLDGLGNKDGSS